MSTEINKALFKFQNEFKGVEKKRVNPFTKSKYASLDDVVNAIKPLLKSCELMVNYQIQKDGDDTVLITKVTHVSGEQIESKTPLMSGVKAQDFGSELTYMRRYTICALLNVVETDDDDGNATMQPEELKITEKQKSTIFDLLDAVDADSSRFKSYLNKTFNAQDIEDLTSKQASICIKTLEAKYKRLQNEQPENG